MKKNLYTEMLYWMYNRSIKGFKEEELMQKFKLNLNLNEKQYYIEIFKKDYLIKHLRYDEDTQSHWYCLTEKGLSSIIILKKAREAKIISWIAIIVSIIVPIIISVIGYYICYRDSIV